MTMKNPTEKDLSLYAESVAREVLDLLGQKGDHYADGVDEPALKNFEECSSFLGRSIPENIMHLATKHWYVLCQWSSGKRKNLDKFKLRRMLIDVIVYMIILLLYVDKVVDWGDGSRDEARKGYEDD